MDSQPLEHTGILTESETGVRITDARVNSGENYSPTTLTALSLLESLGSGSTSKVTF